MKTILLNSFKTLLICLTGCSLALACQRKPQSNNAKLFFVFVNRAVNSLEIQQFTHPEDVGRPEDTPVTIHNSSSFISYLYWNISFVPWDPANKPDKESLYASEWVLPGNPAIEESILQAFEDEHVNSFERIEYREMGIKDIRITSTESVTFGDNFPLQTIPPGESLNRLFEIVSIKTHAEDKGYNNFVVHFSTLKASRLKDAIAVEDYLALSPMAPFNLCLRLKESLYFSLRDCTVHVRLSDNRVLEAHCP